LSKKKYIILKISSENDVCYIHILNCNYSRMSANYRIIIMICTYMIYIFIYLWFIYSFSVRLNELFVGKINLILIPNSINNVTMYCVSGTKSVYLKFFFSYKFMSSYRIDRRLQLVSTCLCSKWWTRVVL